MENKLFGLLAMEGQTPRGLWPFFLFSFGTIGTNKKEMKKREKKRNFHKLKIANLAKYRFSFRTFRTRESQ
ncbi:hypothetical protein ACQ895_01500 [Vibrio parahaemolyticus]|uniref:hypothetical protein n=1 Tax=Vibrio parahaemolyticus TaxID=670 RepID=UPI00387B04F1